MQSLPRLMLHADVGQFSPIRLDSPEGKREAQLARDVHDRVAPREERGWLEVAIAGGETLRGAGEREEEARRRHAEGERRRNSFGNLQALQNSGF